MSFTMMKKINDEFHPFDPTLKLVFSSLASHANEKTLDSIYCAVSTVARQTGLGVSTVEAKMKKLRDLGVIEAYGRGPRGTVAYRILPENFGDPRLPTVEETRAEKRLPPSDSGADTPAGRVTVTHRSEGATPQERGGGHPSSEGQTYPSIKPETEVVESSTEVQREPDEIDDHHHGSEIHRDVEESAPSIVTVEDSSAPTASSPAPAKLRQVDPKRAKHGWEPSPEAKEHAAAIAPLVNLEILTTNYWMHCLEKKIQPSATHWMRWVTSDQKKAEEANRERARQEAIDARTTRPWFSVAE